MFVTLLSDIILTRLKSNTFVKANLSTSNQFLGHHMIVVGNRVREKSNFSHHCGGWSCSYFHRDH